MAAHETLKIRVKAITYEAEDVISLDLRPAEMPSLPSFTAGAHVELRLPNGIERSYSIASPQSESHRYVVGVQNDPASRGGSRFIHEDLRAGAELVISAPRNNFELNEDAERTVLIAGGIGPLRQAPAFLRRYASYRHTTSAAARYPA
jgi:ferredoxin-NADP reductase